MTPNRPYPRWHIVVAAIAVFAATFLVFFSTVRFTFVSFDDAGNVYDNPYLNPVTGQALPRFWEEAYYELYTPVTYSLWTAVASTPPARLPRPTAIPFAGVTTLAAEPFHILGVTLHSANAVLLFFFLLRLLPRRARSPLLAALGALFWAVHPLQAEPVAWVTGNNNVFSGTLMLLALLAFARHIEVKSDSAGWGWYLLATVFYILALLAKPTAAALPLVALALAVGIYRQSPRSLLVPLGTWLCLAAGFLFVTRNTAISVTDVSLPLWQRPFVIGDALAFYTSKIVVPIHLGLDYGRRPEWLRTQPWFYAMWLVPIAVGLLLWTVYKRAADKEMPRVVLTGFAIFVLGALPMLGLAPYYFHRYSTVSDRYLYLALSGVAIVLTALLSNLPRRTQTFAMISFSACIVIFAGQCWKQTHAWQDSQALYRNTIRVNPRSMMGHYNLATIDMDAMDYDAAIQHLELAAKCPVSGPELPALIRLKLGDIASQQGENKKAIAYYKDAVAANPAMPRSRAQLARVLWESGDPNEADRVIADGIKTAKDPVDMAYVIGRELIENGIANRGVTLLTQVAATQHEDAADASYILGAWYVHQENPVRAAPFFQRALQLRPGWQAAQAALASATAK